MRKLLLIGTAVLLMLPVSLMADSIDFAATGGTLVVSGTTLTTTGGTASTLTQAKNSTHFVSGSNIGTVNFATGTLASGSLALGGTFNAAGSSILIATNGLFTGDMNDASAFSGAFSGPITWTFLGSSSYSLGGQVSGTFSAAFASLFGLNSSAGGLFVSGEVVQNGSSYRITSLDISLPEARTLSLLGFGVLGLFGLRRKLVLA